MCWAMCTRARIRFLKNEPVIFSYLVSFVSYDTLGSISHPECAVAFQIAEPEAIGSSPARADQQVIQEVKIQVG